MTFISQMLKMFVRGSSSVPGARLRLFNFSKFQKCQKQTKTNIQKNATKQQIKLKKTPKFPKLEIAKLMNIIFG